LLGSLRGQIYERFVIAALRAGHGGKFPLHELVIRDSLVMGSLQELDMPQRDVAYFSSDMQQIFDSRSIAVPEALNFPTWDAVICEPETDGD
jgi:hypothetical protein